MVFDSTPDDLRYNIFKDSDVELFSELSKIGTVFESAEVSSVNAH